MCDDGDFELEFLVVNYFSLLPLSLFSRYGIVHKLFACGVQRLQSWRVFKDVGPSSCIAFRSVTDILVLISVTHTFTHTPTISYTYSCTYISCVHAHQFHKRKKCFVNFSFITKLIGILSNVITSLGLDSVFCLWCTNINIEKNSTTHWTFVPLLMCYTDVTCKPSDCILNTRPFFHWNTNNTNNHIKAVVKKKMFRAHAFAFSGNVMKWRERQGKKSNNKNNVNVAKRKLIGGKSRRLVEKISFILLLLVVTAV